MTIVPDQMKVIDLLQLRRSDMLTVNSEYQRGAVWNETQQKKLIDSVMRGYPLPLIYLHFKKISVAGMQRDALEIIDGQQRINALFHFAENAFELFDPIEDDKYAKFPNFIKKSPCTWARKKYRDLNDDDKIKFDNTIIFVVRISTDIEDEARDLFIRLQAGLPLNAQEKRDAWPGGYTEFVLQYGGKPEIIRYRGHDFFQKTLKPKIQDRGKIRTYCAQIGMIFFERFFNNKWVDAGTRSIDDYYYKNLDFDLNSSMVKEFKKVLDKLVNLFIGYKGKQIKQHEAIHLVLFVYTLMKEYIPNWEINFINAFDQFRLKVASAKKSKSGPFWDNFSMLVSTHADQAQTVQTRDKFFTEQMLALINPTRKDPNRSFDDEEREIVYLKYNKRCAVCQQIIEWKDLEIHHLKEHHLGGETSIDNAVPVHRRCHPKGNDAIEFEQNWRIFKNPLLDDLSDAYTKEIKSFLDNDNLNYKEIFIPNFPPKLFYVMERSNSEYSISISSIKDIEYKDKFALFDTMKINNSIINFDPYYNNNYGKLVLLIQDIDNKDEINYCFNKFINITKSIIVK
jgi:hypothetical protein